MLKHNHLISFKVGKSFTEALLHCKYDGLKKVKQTSFCGGGCDG